MSSEKVKQLDNMARGPRYILDKIQNGRC